MGSTMEILNGQWIRAVLDYNGKELDREGATRLALEKHAGLLACRWFHTETCRTCTAPEAGKCPVIAVDVAA